MTSSSFDVPVDAQVITFDRQVLATQDDLKVEIAVAPDFSDWTAVSSRSGLVSGGWETVALNASNWTGKTIELRFSSTSGDVDVDNAGISKKEASGWNLSGADAMPTTQIDGAKNYLALNGGDTATSSPLTIPSQGSDLILFDRAVLSAPASLDVRVLSGTGYGNSDLVYSEEASNTSSWQLVGQSSLGLMDLSNWAGQAVELQFSTTGSVGIDNVATNLTTDRFLNPAFPGVKISDPIDPVSGIYTYMHTDLNIPGRGAALDFTRYYNSFNTIDVGLGVGWTDTYSWALDLSGGSLVKVTYPQGGTAYFICNASPCTPTTSPTYDILTTNFSTTYTLTTKGQLVYTFDHSTGSLLSIKDRDNNTTTLSYSSGLLSAVTDPGLRSLNFGYNGAHISLVTDTLSPTNRQVTFTYSSGFLTRVADVNASPVTGPFTVYAYLSGQMVLQADPMGSDVMFNSYDITGRVSRHTNANSGNTCFYYSTLPTNGDASCLGPGLAPFGQTQVRDPGNNTTTYSFDASQRITSIQDPISGDGPTSYTYDPSNNIICFKDQTSRQTAYAWDANGNLIQLVDALNTSISCTPSTSVYWSFDAYNSRNDPTALTDPAGNRTEYLYNTKGDLTTVTRKNPSGTIVALSCYTPDPSTGQVTAVTQSANLVDCVNGTPNVTKYSYNTAGNETGVINPRYSAAGTPKTIIVPDVGGRQLTVTDELGNTTTHTYDNENNVLTTTDGMGGVTTNTYNADGLLLNTVDANRKVAGSGPETGSQCGNGADDDGDSVPDDGCPTAAYLYDAAGHLTQVTDIKGGITIYHYDPSGNMDYVTDALNHTTLYGYDALNRLFTITDPLNKVTTYTYDSRGNLAQVARPNGQTVKYTTTPYDQLDRLKEVEYWTGSTRTYYANFSYDALGNRTSITDSNGTTIYGAVDALGRITSVAAPNQGTVAYQYDMVGNISRIDYGDGKYVTYGYDAANNMLNVKDWWANKQTNYTYLSNNQLSTVTYPSPIGSVSYTYDGANRLHEVDQTEGNIASESIAYTLDSDGNRTQVNDSGNITQYQYDPLYRLTRVDYPSANYATYGYDAVGNRTSIGVNNGNGLSSATYSYNAADENLAFGYDFAGNLTSRSTAQESDIYDAANQLTEIKFGGFDPKTAPSPIACFDMNSGNQAGVDKQDGAVTISDVLKFRPVFGTNWPGPPYDAFYDLNNDHHINTSDILQFSSALHGVEFGKTCPRYYTYNADGLRLSSTLGKFVTSYTWNPVSSQILQEVTKQDTTGVIVSKNTYVYGAAGLVSTTDMNGNQKYIFPDGLGSVTATVNSSDQSLASNYDYEAFGKPTSGSPSDAFLFAGQQYDPIARASAGGLYYLRARYYDPSTGTFLSRDPLPLQLSPYAVGHGRMPAVMHPQPPSTDESAPRPGTPIAVTNPLTLNPYAYGMNNPANETDASGRCSNGWWSFCGMSTASAIALVVNSHESGPSVTPTPTLGAHSNVWSCTTPCPNLPTPPQGQTYYCPQSDASGMSCVTVPARCVQAEANAGIWLFILVDVPAILIDGIAMLTGQPWWVFDTATIIFFAGAGPATYLMLDSHCY